MAAKNPWEISWKEDTTVTKSKQGSSPWTMNWQEEKEKPTQKLSAMKKTSPAQRQYSWSEVPGEFVKNIPSDVGPALQGLVQPFIHPQDTMESLIKAGSAGLTKILPEALLQYAVPAKRQEAEQTAQNIGGALTEENLKRALAEQPISSAMVASSLLTGGGAGLKQISKLGQTGNIVGKTGDILSSVGTYTNPLTPVLKGAEYAIPKILTGAQNTAKTLMQSALKPTIAQLQSGEASVAVDTLLKYGINPTMKGVNKLKTKISDLNEQIKTKINESTATISRDDVVNTLEGTKAQFGSQVDPVADLLAIEQTGKNFVISHPKNISVQLAQKLKQGTYKALSGKYGEEVSASLEAQKALARGLREGISSKVPEVIGLNAEEAKLIKTLNVAERRAFMEANKNPGGLALLTQTPGQFALFMMDKSALFKSLIARAINRSASLLQSPTITRPAQGLLSATQSPLTAASLGTSGLLNEGQ